MSEENIPTLQLTYEQFVEVLRQWDDYMQIKFSEMARNSPTDFSSEGDWMIFGERPFHGYAFANQVNLSDLAELLWQSLAASATEVDRIHDAVFAESQAEHFRKTYSSPAHVASQIRDEEGRQYPTIPPTVMFFRLGKPAQLAIVRDKFLDEAIEIYKQGREIVRNKEQAEKIQWSMEA
jgi:hypothetical protein